MRNNRKYKPTKVDDLVIEDPKIRQRITEYADATRTGHMVLHGPKGTGKSTAARVIAEARCGNPDLVTTFIGADFTTDHFDRIKREWQIQDLCGAPHPTVIIDEIDQLKPIDQQRMRSFVEQNDRGSVIGTTNNPHKLDRPLADRFDQIHLPPVNTDTWITRASEILAAENVDCKPDIVRAILATQNGSIRDVLGAIEDYVIAKRNGNQSV